MVDLGTTTMPEGAEPATAYGEAAKGEGEAARRVLVGGGPSFALVLTTLRADLVDLVDLTDLAERTLGVGLWLRTLSRELLAFLRLELAEMALTAPLSLVPLAPLMLLDVDRVGLVTVTIFLEALFVPTGEGGGGSVEWVSEVGQWVSGSVGWVSGSAGQWVSGSVGQWVGGPVGRWAGGPVAQQLITHNSKLITHNL